MVRAEAVKETQSLLVMPSEAERAERNALGERFLSPMGHTQLIQEPGVTGCRSEPLCNAEQDEAKSGRAARTHPGLAHLLGPSPRAVLASKGATSHW